MRAFEFILKENSVSDLENLKSQISSKIKDLPEDPETLSLLKELEDILQDVGALTYKDYVKKGLDSINDPDVQSAQNIIAKYIVGISPSKKSLKELFQYWKEDSFVDYSKLTTSGVYKIGEIIPLYDSNKLVEELVDDLIVVESYGRGKGEFLFSILSRSINRAEKGDFEIDGGIYELKTKSTRAGFKTFDRSLVPPKKYYSYGDQFEKEFLEGRNIPKTGTNLSTVIEIGKTTDKKDLFKSLISQIIGSLFYKVPEQASTLSNSIISGDINSASKNYVDACFSNYLTVKDYQGVIFLDITKKPYNIVCFKNMEDLTKLGYSFISNTPYPVTDNAGNAYPQLFLSSTSQAGADPGEVDKTVIKSSKRVNKVVTTDDDRQTSSVLGDKYGQDKVVEIKKTLEQKFGSSKAFSLIYNTTWKEFKEKVGSDLASIR
jgi:hypothetical protein